MQDRSYSAGLEQSVDDEIAQARMRQQSLQHALGTPAAPPVPPAPAEEAASATGSAAPGAVAPSASPYPAQPYPIQSPAQAASPQAYPGSPMLTRRRAPTLPLLVGVVAGLLVLTGVLIAVLASRSQEPLDARSFVPLAIWILVLLGLGIVAYGVWVALTATGKAAPARRPAATYRRPEDELDALSLQITRLEQLRGWMATDSEFGRLVDAMIGKQVLAAEARQKQRAIITAVVSSVLSLLAGWLLSAISPTTTLLQLLHW
ncbi:MAG TPA: hypothetical protein VF807_15500 [Ktedonobacterales bacterium]